MYTPVPGVRTFNGPTVPRVYGLLIYDRNPPEHHRIAKEHGLEPDRRFMVPGSIDIAYTTTDRAARNRAYDLIRHGSAADVEINSLDEVEEVPF